MASNFLSEPITDIINTAIDTNTFLDRAKRASVTHQLTKVGMISTFTLIVNHFLSILVSAYRKMCGTQHVLIILIEEWWGRLTITNCWNCSSGFI